MTPAVDLSDAGEATVQIGAMIPKTLADSLRELARRSERSAAAEIRLAVKAWVDAADVDLAA